MRPSIFLVASITTLTGCSTWLDYGEIRFRDAAPHQDASVPDAHPDVAPLDATHDTSVLPDATPTDAKAEATDAIADTVISEPKPDPCENVTCSDKGTCEQRDGGPSCTCQPGFHAEGLSCKKDETCDGVSCGSCSNCKVIDGKATCTCPDGFKHSQSGCWPDPDPCDTKQCAPDEVCVPVSHCGVYGGCHKKCDCSNCGNCNTPDWFQYCGSDKSPPTKKCNNPCPTGQGCCMFSQPFCWPGECCMSL